MKKLSLTMFLVGLAIASFAQTQRVVLHEYFTNASCAPCAAATPVLMNTLATLGESKVVTVSYHVWYPGVDPMYNHNTQQVRDRHNLYNLNGVPNSVIDGNVYNGHPNGATYQKFDDRSMVASPFSLDIRPGFSGDSLTVNMTVKASQNVPNGNYKAYIVAIEKEVNFVSPPGTNGMTKHEYVMKYMLTGSGGSSLPATFNTNDEVVVSGAWKMANIYDLSQLRIVGFVQNMNNKEVMQAGMAGNPIPFTINLAINSATPQLNVQQPATPKTYTMDFSNTNSQAETYKFKLLKDVLPSGWSASFSVNGNTSSDSLMLSVGAGASQQAVITITPSAATPGKGKVYLEVSPTSSFTMYKIQKEAILISGVPTLVISKHPATTNAVANALTGINRINATLEGGEVPLLPADQYTSTNFKNILWHTGSDYGNCVSEAEAGNLVTFLNTGGRIMFQGSDIGYYINGNGTTMRRSLYQNYIGARYLVDGDGSDPAEIGATTDFLLNTYGSAYLNSSYSHYSDRIAPRTPAIAIMNYFQAGSPDTAAALRNEKPITGGGSYKTAYFAFRMEALDDASVRDSITSRVFMWFDGLIGPTALDDALARITMQQNFPNPANESTTIRFSENSKPILLKVIDVLGKEVHQQWIPAGQQEVTINTASFGNGVYIYQLSDGVNPITSKKLIIQH
ncbi:MAG: T9SS type A sorting domain-containing protein [Bacteroidia bacterium]|nr:T9SS type A sorting domain-containing protein [Bacteroidia bacterium]